MSLEVKDPGQFAFEARQEAVTEEAPCAQKERDWAHTTPGQRRFWAYCEKAVIARERKQITAYLRNWRIQMHRLSRLPQNKDLTYSYGYIGSCIDDYVIGVRQGKHWVHWHGAIPGDGAPQTFEGEKDP